MKKISILLLVIVAALASCKKVPEVNTEYVDVERDLITVGTTQATIQCDYEYIATLKKAYFHYGEGSNTANMTSAEMHVVQKTLYVELSDLKENTTYSYYYEFANGFNSMWSATKTFKTEGSPVTPPEITLPTVVTAEVSEITSNSAQCGGEVTNDGGAEVTERGICWSTSVNPTLNDSHIASGTGTGAFTAMMSSLEANTTYHVRAYATNEKGTAYGLDRGFVTLLGGSNHEYVDMGLPSGILWATCNVGANFPEEYGDYYAWGETEIKEQYDGTNYIYGCVDTCAFQYTMTKYCNNPEYGFNGFTDTLTVLQPEDDAAQVQWGDGWRIPSLQEWEELLENTTNIWTTLNGVNGRLFTASNGSTIFLPAAGLHHEDEGTYYSGQGDYWSNSLDLECPTGARDFFFKDCAFFMSATVRLDGASVRPVRSAN